ncbi:Gfo/Idh/MocA family protein [Pelagicoccus mobilis]|uniref:Gfo/Idh/MocA family oxidoreductase n=1 Tax=Pelagicoccus mobilis TaxID=415221 RepID=A0A934VPS7_9BACT|nr:Gfo/Idh/MocA family oxidoreductase [Pelagicoccus mobilis]MBK1875843.1 Gfo/Idh/MocA family oxidoreductase [Pelagicoccus mobilis]
MKTFLNSRRGFLGLLAGIGGAVVASSTSQAATRRKGQYMGDYAAEKLDTIRIVFIGVGARGRGHAKQFATIEGTEVVGICDLYEDLALQSQKDCEEVGAGSRHRSISVYSRGKNQWRKMLAEQKPDAVVIATPWKDHAPMAIATMEAGAHAFVEVPLALTNNELWDVVDTSEKTRKHCMMMENVNYGRDELLYLNMCRQGVVGDLLHGEAAYIHELRGQMVHEKRGTGYWRTHHYAKRNGNLYPTHGLGPVAQYMNLARGEDNFGSLVSFSTPALGRAQYASDNFSDGHKWNSLDYRGGDLNTSIIKTQLGRTIMVQWDETSPRPYSRLNLVQGTKGCLAGFPTRVALEGGVEGATEDHHKWAEGEGLAAIYEKYEHPLQKRLGALAKKMGGHGGMDFMMRYRIVECLRKGEPLDQNVYEGAFWSAVAPLSEESVRQGGAPQAFPDFTRGDWSETNPLGVVS